MNFTKIHYDSMQYMDINRRQYLKEVKNTFTHYKKDAPYP